MDADMVKLLLQAGSTGVLLAVLAGIYFLVRAALRPDGAIFMLAGALKELHLSITKVDGRLEGGIKMAADGRDRQQQTLEAVHDDVRDVRDKFLRIEGKLRIGSDPNLPKAGG